MYFKFQPQDIFRNSIVTYPTYKCLLIVDTDDELKCVINSRLPNSIAQSLDISGSISMLDNNIDRAAAQMMYSYLDKTSGNVTLPGYSSSSVNALAYGATMTASSNVFKNISFDYINSSTSRISSSLINHWNTYGYGEFPASCSYFAIPREFYGSKIKKGSVTAGIAVYSETYAVAQDIYQDGVLRIIDDSLVNGTQTGTIVGYVMYGEGVIVFKSASIFYSASSGAATHITAPSAFEWSSGSDSIYNWKFFGDRSMCDFQNTKGMCWLNFQGTNQIEHLTMMCTAPGDKLNHSNNPTYIEYQQNLYLTQTSESTFVENIKLNIANVVSSSFNITEDFKKETCISEVLIFNEKKQLLGIAKLANPLVKKEGVDYTIKLGYDLL